MNSTLGYLGYLIDSDVLITAKNRYYAFSICPGFWDSILHSHSLGHVHSIDRVRDELLRGRDDDDLVKWIGRAVPAGFFLSSEVGKVVDGFAEIMRWAGNKKQYKEAAKTEFAESADGWLVAYGMANAKTVVTNEQSRTASRKKIQLPDVCNAFSVDFEDTFAMLHTLGVQFRF